MKLLFDENLAPALVDELADIFRESTHVRQVGLKSSPDGKVWDYAAEMGYAIVTKDADFRQRSFVFGPPPKVIWIYQPQQAGLKDFGCRLGVALFVAATIRFPRAVSLELDVGSQMPW